MKERIRRVLRRGDPAAAEELIPLLYDELRKLAQAYLRKERVAHTLQPTALTNELYLRLADDAGLEVRGRAQFMAIAARVMRQILVDHARTRGARKRGGGLDRVTMSDDIGVLGRPVIDILDLHEGLEALARLDERKARVVEARFFAGLTIPETAAALQLSETTVEDDWFMARAWLRHRLADRE